MDFQKLVTPSDWVTIMATPELTDKETWTAWHPDHLLAFDQGMPLELSP
ncbi:MAG: class II glutamine amidotransferase [Cyanobacteriota bacterium]|jgi:predicted glutamine amidotransferase|nr:class II glutamine amidotransferase [Cyanobacteriota bacterium]